MFVLLLTYNAPLERVEPFMEDHMAWVDTHYAAGTFVASGRRVPRTGGVILTAHRERGEIEDLVVTDPFWREGIVSYEIVEFAPSRTAPGLEALMAEAS